MTIIFNFEIVGKKNPLTDDDYNEMSDLQKFNFFTNQMDNLYQNIEILLQSIDIGFSSHDITVYYILSYINVS